MSQVLDYIGIAFTFVFLVETVIKIIGLGLLYFKFSANIFDFLVTIISVVATIAE